MIDYSMVKCELMEPKIGTGYTFSERSEFHGPRKYSKNNKPRLGEQGSLIVEFSQRLRNLGLHRIAIKSIKLIKMLKKVI